VTTPPASPSGARTKTARATRSVYAADLNPPDAVSANARGATGGLGWLLWLLLVGALLLALAPIGWRWMHGRDDAVAPDDA
jgi:hypothetical protein